MISNVIMMCFTAEKLSQIKNTKMTDTSMTSSSLNDLLDDRFYQICNVYHCVLYLTLSLTCFLKTKKYCIHADYKLKFYFDREKESHSRHLRQLEEEMEVQMARVESRVRTEEKERTDAEKEELKRQLEAEIAELRSNLNRLHKVRKIQSGLFLFNTLHTDARLVPFSLFFLEV